MPPYVESHSFGTEQLPNITSTILPSSTLADLPVNNAAIIGGTVTAAVFLAAVVLGVVIIAVAVVHRTRKQKAGG